MDIVEFAEKCLGLELLEYQKELLRLYSLLPRDCRVVMGRSGPVICDGNGDVIGKLNKHGVSKALLGTRADFVYVDEINA